MAHLEVRIVGASADYRTAAHNLWPGLSAYSLVVAQAHKFEAYSLVDIVAVEAGNRFALADRSTDLEDIVEVDKSVDFEPDAVAQPDRRPVVGVAAQFDLDRLVVERCAELAAQDDPMWLAGPEQLMGVPQVLTHHLRN